MRLPERLVALHEALSRRRIPHAFGGAIALAYWTEDPRGTSDIDINVFVPEANGQAVLDALPEGVVHDEHTAGLIARDGQVRLFWDETPVDLFFDNVPVHEQAAAHRRSVPYEGMRIPILGPVELAVFKVMFNRSQDWVDLENMATAGTLDVDAVGATLVSMLGPDDPRLARLAELKPSAR